VPFAPLTRRLEEPLAVQVVLYIALVRSVELEARTALVAQCPPAWRGGWVREHVAKVLRAVRVRLALGFVSEGRDALVGRHHALKPVDPSVLAPCHLLIGVAL